MPDPVTSPRTLLQRLKEDTRSLHDAVELAMDSQAIMEPDFSLEAYTLLLQRLWHAHMALEPAISACISEQQFPELMLNQRLSKRHLLEREWVSQPSARPVMLPKSLHFATVDEAWGAFYVLEGSTLGGAMIFKQLLKHQWPGQEFLFYNVYGKNTGAMWSSFRKAFTRQEQLQGLKAEKVLQGAEIAYGQFLIAAEKI